MRKIISVFIVLLISSVTTYGYAAMNLSEVRENARFLTDKMVYELNLTSRQYNDIYEVNYDFLRTVRYTLDYIVRGSLNAYDEYYEALDIRNEDLRWILTSRQYNRFMQIEYFFRPIYMLNRKCYFRIYRVYTNRARYYFDFPYGMRNYRGEHYHTYHKNRSYYQNRYKHESYRHPVTLRDRDVYFNNRNADFGNNGIFSNGRPSENQRPGFTVPNQSPTHPKRPNNGERPNRNYGGSRPSRTEKSSQKQPEKSNNSTPFSQRRESEGTQSQTSSPKNQVNSGAKHSENSPYETMKFNHTGEKKNKSNRR